jgi:hypothetical protein
LIAPEERYVVDVQIPGEGEEDGSAQEGPEEEADWEGAHQRNLRHFGSAEKEAAGQANAGCEPNAGERSNQALIPSGGWDEEGGVQQGVQRDVAEDEGNGSAEIEKQVAFSSSWIGERGTLLTRHREV